MLVSGTGMNTVCLRDAFVQDLIRDDFLALHGLADSARSLVMSSIFLGASLNPSFKNTRYSYTWMPSMSKCFFGV